MIRGLNSNSLVCDDYVEHDVNLVQTIIESFSKVRGIMKLKVKRLSPTSKLPTKAHDTDAGWDLYADITHPVTIPTNGLATIDTGIAMAIPKGYCGQIWDRSSYGVNGTTKLAGVIDCSYRASVKVVLYSFRGKVINPGDKFAQILILPVPEVEIEEVENLDDTERGEGGFGSSGR